MSFVADTDVLIDFLRGSGEGAERIELELKTGALCTTSISAFELWVGARGAREVKLIEALLGATVILPLDEAAARRSAEVRRLLDGKGLTIGMADSLIAGTCLHFGGVLITRNTKHFSRVPGLKLAGTY